MTDKAAPCPNYERNEKVCNCSSTGCARHGVCCECVAYHAKAGGLPACLRQ